MATGTLNTTARRNALQVVHTARFKMNFNDAGIATGVATGIWIPQGAIILPSLVEITTAFNAATTNVLSIGFEASTYTNLVTTAQAVAGTAGYKPALSPTGLAIVPLAADQQIYYLYTQTGAVATAGAGYAVISWCLDNDRNSGQ